jgi:hypothetical protein
VTARTTCELAPRIGVTETAALSILHGLERNRLAEQGEEGWRFTAQAERRYGRALRLVTTELWTIWAVAI